MRYFWEILICKNFFLNFFLPKYRDFSAKSSEESIFHGSMALQQTVLSESWLFIATSLTVSLFWTKKVVTFQIFYITIRNCLSPITLLFWWQIGWRTYFFGSHGTTNKTFSKNLDFFINLSKEGKNHLNVINSPMQCKKVSILREVHNQYSMLSNRRRQKIKRIDAHMFYSGKFNITLKKSLQKS